jgi:hypothetical protein
LEAVDSDVDGSLYALKQLWARMSKGGLNVTTALVRCIQQAIAVHATAACYHCTPPAREKV